MLGCRQKVKSGRSSVDKSKSILKYAKNKVIVAKPGLVIVKTGELSIFFCLDFGSGFSGLGFSGLGFWVTSIFSKRVNFNLEQHSDWSRINGFSTKMRIRIYLAFKYSKVSPHVGRVPKIIFV